MFIITVILFLVGTLGTMGELRVQHIGDRSRYHPAPFHNSEGSCYEKPIGKCFFNKTSGELDGCHCSPPAFPGFNKLTKAGDVDLVICTVECDKKPCPKAPKGTGSCDPVKMWSLCMINCNNDKDCPETAVCTSWGACMYRP